MPARLLKRHNLCVVTRTYKKDGQDKNNFERIGQLLEFEGEDGGKWMKVDLYHMPGVQISVFEQKPKDEEF